MSFFFPSKLLYKKQNTVFAAPFAFSFDNNLFKNNMRELLGLLNLTRAKNFYINKMTKIVVISKHKRFVLVVF